MKLLNYYALYMHDFSTSVIPDLLSNSHETQLFVSDRKIDYLKDESTMFLHQTQVMGKNPNTESSNRSFCYKNKEMPVNSPFFERTFAVRFDIISGRDEDGNIKSSFELLEFLVYDYDGAFQVDHSFRYFCEVDLTKIAFQGGFVYQGSLKMKLNYTHPTSNISTTHDLGVYAIKATDDTDATLVNFISDRSYMKSFYRKGNFYSILKPQTLLINVDL
jgi:hypothetical protein